MCSAELLKKQEKNEIPYPFPLQGDNKKMSHSTWKSWRYIQYQGS